MSKTVTSLLIVAIALAFVACPSLADQAAPLSALARIPVKEVTIFKDGHVFAMHQGKMPTDSEGNVLMDYLPTPVLGAFWPFSADKSVKLSAVVASKRKVLVERTSLSVRELIEGNIGASAIITEVPVGRDAASMSYPATIVGVPVRTSRELAACNPPGTPESLPQKGKVVLLKTTEGTRVVSFDRIQCVTFKDAPKSVSANEEFRNLLTLKLDWPGGKAGKAADVGLFYLQRGLRWIPSYKVTIDGKGKAAVKLQGTLINELTDLKDVTANLVIGVPTFAFADKIDPMALQQTLVQLSQHFRPDTSGRQYLSNALTTQVAGPRAGYTARRAGAAPAPNLGPEIAGSQRSEDLFLFTVKHVSLKKGQRMVIPIQEFTLKYKDIYTLDIPFTPPPEVWRQIGNQQQREAARLMAKPKVTHKIRLSNKSAFPLTTAPALIVRDGRVLAQGMMLYTARGADTDLAITTAVDVNVKKTDKETGRVPNAVQWQGHQYARIDLAGTIKLTNYRPEAIDLEVTRYVLGNLGEVSNDGKVSMVNIFEDGQFTPGGQAPRWWGWYSWPYWWSHFNGVGKIEWKLKLQPGADKAVELKYKWNYYWR